MLLTDQLPKSGGATLLQLVTLVHGYNPCENNDYIQKNKMKFIRNRSRLSSHLSPLTLKVVGAPQMTLQQ